MLNGITINKGQGGLGRPLEGTDYISGFLFYTDATLPSGFTSNDRIKTVYSVADAENLGITNASLGETKAISKAVVGGTPAAGDTVQLSYLGINGSVIYLPTYTLKSADAVSTTTAAAAIAAAINAQTINFGFTGSNSTATLLVTTKAGEGIFPNSGTPFSSTVTGGTTLTWTQPTGSGSTVLGVASDIDILHYHISEFFRLQPKGKLYVGCYATADFGTFASITLMQNYAQGSIRQMLVYHKGTAFATSQCNAIQSVCTTLEANHKPIWNVILAGEISGTANVNTITTNLHTLSNPNASVCIGQDGANLGYKLFKANGKSITNGGEMLGAVALSAVNESIAWFGKFQVSSTELDVIAFANGQEFTTVSDGTITNLDSYGFCFLLKVPNLIGTYHNRPYTCTSITSDYAFIYSNRVIYKCIENVRTTVLPAVASPVKFNTDGTLSGDSVNYFKTLAAQGLDTVLNANEISAYETIINPSQNVLSTNTLEITIKILPLGVADFITINIGFTTTL